MEPSHGFEAQISLEDLESLLHPLQDQLVLVDKDLNVLWANPAAKGLLGEPVEGKKCFGVFHNRKTPCLEHSCSVQKAFENGGVHTHDMEVAVKNGATRFLRCTAGAVLRDGNGIPTGVLMVLRDLTMQISVQRELQAMKESLRRTEEELLESKSKYKQILENAPVGVHVIDLTTGKMIRVNDIICHYTGYSREEILAMDPADLLTEESRSLYFERLAMILAGQKPPEEAIYRLKARDGRSFWAVCNSRVSYENGVPQRATVVFQEITRLKETEEALRRSEENLRRLSFRLLTVQEEERKRIARDLHDTVLQKLAYTKMSMGLRLNQMESGAASSEKAFLKDSISVVKGAIGELREVIEDLRPSLLDQLGLLSAVRSYCREFGERYPRIRLEVNIDLPEKDLPESSKIPMFRIIQESLNNIVKHSRAEHARVSIEKSGGFICLRVSDDGIGFELLEKAPRGEGGFGLSGMRERAALSRGAFSFHSSKGKGTLVEVIWPAPSGAQRKPFGEGDQEVKIDS
jgi:PAS domain S-box-containing protein